MKRNLLRVPLEAIVWLAGLVALAISSPQAQGHFTVCPLALLGFDFCPGCGLGRSVSYLFHGEFARSFTMHPLGIFAVIVLSYRIIQLILNHLRSHGQNY
jgi:hypothetical protein